MSSSDDDRPLGSSRPRPSGVNGHAPKSAAVISPSVDAALDRRVPTNGAVEPGISIRNGPMVETDTSMKDASAANGTKRKARESLTRPAYAEAESSDDNIPLSKKRRMGTALETDSDDEPLQSKANGKILKKPPRASNAQIGEDSDSDIPLDRKLVQEKKKIQNRAEKEAKIINKQDAEKASKKPLAKPSKVKKEESSDDDVPLLKKTTAASKTTPKAAKGKVEPAARKSKAVKKEETEEPEEDGEDEEAKWWQNPMQGDGENKWTTLQHAGVLFPPEYEPLPKSVKMKYNGIPVMLQPEAEEVASFFGAMLNSTHNVENPTFQKNFFNDFRAVLKKTGGAKDSKGEKVDIKEFSKCDFKPIFEYYDAQREAKKALPKEEKKKIKAEKDAAEAKYQYCLWDGKKQKVGNFRVEPPGLFRGRGEHPKTGMVKTRVPPEAITINIGKEATVPPPPPGHKWKEVKHDRTGTWLAMWQENINGNYKYVMLAASADVKGQSDHKKFEKARNLKKHIARIRKDYQKHLKAELMVDRQKATAVYLIDQFALRAGNEKSDDEADTVGCCSLKYENVTLREPNHVLFDFLGKDSIRFHEEFEVDRQVFKNLNLFKKAPKKEGDEIFDRLTTTALNKHLQNYMPGLTAKVFRTYNASYTMSQVLKDIKPGGNVAEKVKDYNEANRKVAILCNHKRTVTAAHGAQMEKIGDKLKGMRYQAWRLKQMMIDVDPKIRKKKGADFFNLPEDMDDEWVERHIEDLVEQEKMKITKKFEKENEKRVADGEKEMKAKELEERLKDAKELEKKLKKEHKSKKVEAEGKGPSIEKLEGNLEKLEQRIVTASIQAEDKENNKEVALGTSKINYIDPRLTVVYSKKFNVPIEKFFSKTLREKFQWAIESADADWEF